jgi:hypothetical protein
MESAVADELQQMLAEQIRCQNEQDLQGVLRFIHKESFSYIPTQQLLMKLFATYQLQLSLLDRKLIAIDGDYAFLRFQLKSEKLDGPDFRDNIADSIVVFRRLNDQWKIWCQSPINFQAVQKGINGVTQ